MTSVPHLPPSRRGSRVPLFALLLVLKLALAAWLYVRWA